MKIHVSRAMNFCLMLFLTIFVLAETASAGFLYAVNDNAAGNMIYGFSVNESTGELTALAGFPIATGFNGGGSTNLEMLTIDKLNKRLYVINRGSNTISAYSIDEATGMLALLPFSPITGVAEQRTIKVHPSGSPLIVGADTFASFNITAKSATPAAGSPYAMPANVSPTASVLTPDGSYYYAGGNSGNFFAGYSIDQATGVMTPIEGSPFDSGNATPNPTAIDASGRLYVINSRQALVRVYTLVNGVPTPVTNSPFSGTMTGFAAQGKVHPNGQFFALSNRTRNHFYVHLISGSGAATELTVMKGSPIETGGTSSLMNEFNDDGTLFFSGNGTSRNISSFRVDPATGAFSDRIVQAVNTMGDAGSLTGMDYVNFGAAAQSVSVAGRVADTNGVGQQRLQVTFTDKLGATRTAATNSFGYYKVDGLLTGEAYTVTVIQRRTVVLTEPLQLKGELSDLNFTIPLD